MRKLLLTLLVILSAACRNQEQIIPDATDEGRWYQLTEGRLETVAGPEAFSPVPLRPWTVQSRIADLAEVSGEVFLAVNGYGLAALRPAGNPGGSERIRYFYDPTLFAHRTISTLIAEPESLLCHLYFNRLLNTVPPESLLLQGISLVRHHPAEDVYELIMPPFQDRHPGWEVVGFLPQSPKSFLLEYKYTDDQETRFSYGRLTLDPFAETPAERASFRGGYDFRAPAEAPPLLRRLLTEAARTLRAGKPGVSLHFLVRSPESPLIRRYASPPRSSADDPGARLLTLHALERDGRGWLLMPDGTLLTAAGEEAPRRQKLPALPPGFAYTGLLVSADSLLLSWEQADFIQVGAAGLYVCPASGD